MTKQIPAIVLAITCTALSIGLYRSNRKVTVLEDKIAELEAVPMPRVAERLRSATTRVAAGKPLSSPGPRADSQPETMPVADEEGKEGASRRMMTNLANMLENPTMNKVMVASQRGALQALYGDLIESFEFTGEEEDYFMDLLMSRQMKQLEFGMKMMGGEMSDEERTKMGEELKEIGETVKTEMEKFLNNADDYNGFEFYEKTMGERMMLSQMTQKLEASNVPLSDETHRELLQMMHDERKDFDFSTDLHDNQNTDLSAERFSKENLQQFSEDMDRLNRGMIGKAKNLLTAEQLSTFEESVEAIAEMQKSQMEMAANMFRGGEEEK